MMQTINLNKNPEIVGYSFALSESCFWCATILDYRELYACPTCACSVSLIPLGKDEQYNIKLGSSIEMSFSKRVD